MESLLMFLKSVPSWMATIAEMLVVILASMIVLSLIAGFWVALCILKRRQDYIAEVSFLPFRITFHPRNKDEP